MKRNENFLNFIVEFKRKRYLVLTNGYKTFGYPGTSTETLSILTSYEGIKFLRSIEDYAMKK